MRERPGHHRDCLIVDGVGETRAATCTISTVSLQSELTVILGVNVGKIISNTWPMRSGDGVCKAISGI
jgi:hypothetical protein